MNNIDSPAYRPRWIEPAHHGASRDHPVIVLTGARQVGKSTILQHALPFRDWRYRSLDDLDVLAQARDVRRAVGRRGRHRSGRGAARRRYCMQ
ncbi:MAG: hypothetical protein U0470_11230 [Anaerolineae bacterium]